MKVVFYADLSNISASGRQRLWALSQCGVEIFEFNKETYLPALGRWSGYIAKLLKQPQLMRNTTLIEQDLFELCNRVKPDIVWFEWPRELQQSTFQRLKQINPRPLLISFQDDNPWGSRRSDKWMWKNYFNVVPEFDLHLVKRPEDYQHLKKLGATHCYSWKHGIYRPMFYPASVQEEKKYPVSFVGTCMDQRVDLFRYLLEQGIPIHIFGNRWEQRSNLPREYPENFHSAVEGECYADVIRQSQICLGLVSLSNRDEWTMRTYEVPGCAKLLLAQRTPTHEALFEDNKEAAFFSTHIECRDKLLRLLSEPDRCIKMGKAAYDKFISNNWTLENNMHQLLTYIEKHQEYLLKQTV